MNDDIRLIEQALEDALPSENCLEKDVVQAMRYSLMAGGKRIRPVLTLEFCRACAGTSRDALPFACAVEMIHTYSLIHDDLPCMDNDAMRRGKPANHIAFGEDIALLAGDALQSLAFETIFRSCTPENAMRCSMAARFLANACGACGMVGGQVIDLQNENRNAPIETLKIMDAKKTGALIKAACVLGCIAADADAHKIHAAAVYAEKIGLAFQIVDDILDITSDEETLGKPVGSDMSRQKSTYVSLLGLQACRRLAQELTQEAIYALHIFEDGGQPLADLARALVTRTS